MELILEPSAMILDSVGCVADCCVMDCSFCGVDGDGSCVIDW